MRKTPDKTKALAAAELSRLMGENWVERCLVFENVRALIEHAIAVVIRITQGENMTLAFEGAKWLAGYAKGLEGARVNGGVKVESERSVLVAELREIYKQALPASKVVESTSEES